MDPEVFSIDADDSLHLVFHADDFVRLNSRTYDQWVDEQLVSSLALWWVLYCIIMFDDILCDHMC